MSDLLVGGWSKPVAELLALHEAFRRLGFPYEELFVEIYPNMPVFKLVHNGISFTIANSYPFLEFKKEEFAEEWQRAVKWWNEGNGKEMDARQKEVYKSSNVLAHPIELVQALFLKGIRPPNAPIDLPMEKIQEILLRGRVLH